jgi:hypothetical protein
MTIDLSSPTVRPLIESAAREIIVGFLADHHDVTISDLCSGSGLMHDYEDANERFLDAVSPLFKRLTGVDGDFEDDAFTDLWNAVTFDGDILENLAKAMRNEAQ